jgi:hypothetical protein
MKPTNRNDLLFLFLHENNNNYYYSFHFQCNFAPPNGLQKVTEPKIKGEKSANPIIKQISLSHRTTKTTRNAHPAYKSLSLFSSFSQLPNKEKNKIEETQSYTKQHRHTQTLTGTVVGWTRLSAETIAVAAAFMVSTLLLFTLLILFVSFRSKASSAFFFNKK